MHYWPVVERLLNILAQLPITVDDQARVPTEESGRVEDL